MQKGGRDETKAKRGIPAIRYFRPLKETDKEITKMFVGLHFWVKKKLRMGLLASKFRTDMHYGMNPFKADKVVYASIT